MPCEEESQYPMEGSTHVPYVVVGSDWALRLNGLRCQHRGAQSRERGGTVWRICAILIPATQRPLKENTSVVLGWLPRMLLDRLWYYEAGVSEGNWAMMAMYGAYAPYMAIRGPWGRVDAPCR